MSQLTGGFLDVMVQWQESYRSLGEHSMVCTQHIIHTFPSQRGSAVRKDGYKESNRPAFTLALHSVYVTSVTWTGFEPPRWAAQEVNTHEPQK